MHAFMLKKFNLKQILQLPRGHSGDHSVQIIKRLYFELYMSNHKQKLRLEDLKGFCHFERAFYFLTKKKKKHNKNRIV